MPLISRWPLKWSTRRCQTPMLPSFPQEGVSFQMFVKFFRGLSKINIFFMILSLLYIGGIFLLSDSSIASDLSHFNPHSLLHIPLYGILTLLLYLSLNPNSLSPSRFLFWFPIIISMVVAALDEIHQMYIPFRQASIGDIFLDVVGIALAAFLLFTHIKKKKIRWNL